MLNASSVAPILADLFFCAFLVVLAFVVALVFRGVRHASRAG